jgi:hypothetical protein
MQFLTESKQNAAQMHAHENGGMVNFSLGTGNNP